MAAQCALRSERHQRLALNDKIFNEMKLIVAIMRRPAGGSRLKAQAS